MSSTSPGLENIARVIRVDDARVWLEPEVTTSCGHCSARAACGTSGEEPGGIGTIASRVAARRFSLSNPAGSNALQVGERVVIAVAPRALLKGAILAYALPLFIALFAAALCQARYNDDAITLLGTLAGLAAGLLIARFAAGRLAARGELEPRFIRRARPDEHCHSQGVSQ